MRFPSGDESSGEGESPRLRPFLGVSLPGRSAGRDPAAAADEPGAGSPRPFVLTSGRVLGHDPNIGMETQVTARGHVPGRHEAPLSLLPRELQAIVAACAEPISIAEISARLHLHLDVTKILVGDLRTAGYLDVHTTDTINPTDPDTILRVIHGLRAIS